MTNSYISRDAIKAALSIPTTATADNAQIDAAAESVSRLIDDFLGFPVYPHQAVRYFTPTESGRLYLDTPLRAITSIRTDEDGNASHESTWSTADYWLSPSNANPSRPYWEIETQPSATAGYVFPTGVRRSVEINGLWGYTNSTKSTTATLASAPNATQQTIDINDLAVTLHPGQTLQIGTEQIFIRERNSAASQLTVERAVNGSTAASYASALAIAVYEYPIFSQACLYQAAQDYRAGGMPMGMAGGEPFGTQTMRMGGGLHPFTQRSLERFRMPTVV